MDFNASRFSKALTYFVDNSFYSKEKEKERERERLKSVNLNQLSPLLILNLFFCHLLK
jgi:hypothetical protein